MQLTIAGVTLLLILNEMKSLSTRNTTKGNDGRNFQTRPNFSRVRRFSCSKEIWDQTSREESASISEESNSREDSNAFRKRYVNHKSKSSYASHWGDAFRSFDGSRNNRRHATWGTARTPFQRLLPARYCDGVEGVRKSSHGSELPSTRLVSSSLFRSDRYEEDPLLSLLAMQWGQIVAHDVTALTVTTQTRNTFKDCCADMPCSNMPMLLQENGTCMPIEIPSDDPQYSPHFQTCMNFIRSEDSTGRHCRPSEQVNAASHYLDASFVYGSSQELADSLREFSRGRLRSEVKDGRVFPPPAANKMASCAIEDDAEACYLGGDVRINQNPNVAVLQTVFLREHNRISEELANLNPHWNDERIFQETRRIVIAEHQHITYNEYLPAVLGTQALTEMDCSYDEKVNPSTLNSFAAAAFRHPHSSIPSFLRLFDENLSSTQELILSDNFERPGVIEHGCIFDELLRGMTTQAQKKADKNFSPEVMQHLFRFGATIGQDLIAIDIQRGRDHGLATYNDFRQLQGLPRAVFFEDFQDRISEEDVRNLAGVYEHPDDVDLMVGGLLEYHVDGAFTTPTFMSIMLEQFYRTCAGDRYFYHNKLQVYPFDKSQLAEIRKSTVSRLICDNSDLISEMQPRGFYKKSLNNEVVPCSVLPIVDLRKWIE